MGSERREGEREGRVRTKGNRRERDWARKKRW